MASLYVTEQNATLRKEANRLVVERDGRALAEIHDFKIDRLVVVGNVQLTSHAVSFLLDAGIDTAFVSVYGRLKGRLVPLESKNVPLRVRQYERAGVAEFALGVARAVVGGKIANCVEVLSRHKRNHPEVALDAEIGDVAAMLKHAARATTRDTLLGMEGQAAAAYFRGFARMLRRGVRFEGRTRRPPRDPVNSLLSFGYTLLYNEAIGALAGAGFDPYLGFYHGVHYGRCSLALDLIEELRPVAVDRLALAVVNKEVLRESDFVRNEDGGVYMNADGRKRFLREYERAMTVEFAHRQTGDRTTLRQTLQRQAQAMRRTVVHGVAYDPFRGWH